jgi:hypothetical protein
MKKYIYVIIGILVITMTYLFVDFKASQSIVGDNDEALNVPTVSEEKKSIIEKVVEKVEEKVEKIEDSVRTPNVALEVPFTSQAPFGNWDAPYDEACEEASMLMVDAYLKGYALDQSTADQAIVDQYTWQTEQGYPIDITASQVQRVFADYWGITSRLVKNPRVEDITNALDEGSLVVVPAAGRFLENPYFTPPGPLYHMFVITGYDSVQKEFITNDPGTRRGEGYRYSYETIMYAIHDWNNGDVVNGEKVILVVPVL